MVTSPMGGLGNELASRAALCSKLERGPMNALVDTFGRTLDYLRISVTDRCNFRCSYCMPPEGITCLPKQSWLSFGDITRIAQSFVDLGGTQIRLTGGEPLLRPQLTDLVAQLAAIPGLQDLGLTSNGLLLAPQAQQLRDAGLQRVNISLDSMDPKRFHELTTNPNIDAVWESIHESLRVGFRVKVNVVAIRGISTQEILDFGKLAATTNIEVRFIEFMPLCGTGWHPEWMLPLSEVRDTLAAEHEMLPQERGSNVAESYRLDGGTGTIGFIASMTEPFCGDCNRLRLTADGQLRPCLFSHEAIDMKHALQSHNPDAALRAAFFQAAADKPAGHGINPAQTDPTQFPEIRFVGG